MKEAWQDVAGKKGEGVSRKDGEREEFRQGKVIQTESPSKKESCFISLSLPASLPKGIPPPSTLINSSLELSTFFKKQ